MKPVLFLCTLGTAFVLFYTACKKDNSNPTPPPPPSPPAAIDAELLKGHWNLDYVIAADLSKTPARRDTFYPVHNGYAEFTADSLTTYSWVCFTVDNTVTPPKYVWEEKCEFKWTNHYVIKNNYYILYTPNHTDTSYVIKLTANELMTQGKSSFLSGVTDSYAHYTK